MVTVDGVSTNSAREERRDWKAKYAYLPKRINGSWVWRELYYVREVYGPYRRGNAPYLDWEWRNEYGTILDVLKDT